MSSSPSYSSEGLGQGRGGRNAKRKFGGAEGVDAGEVTQRIQKKGRGELYTPSLGPNGFPKEYPMNKEGYRYVLAEADPHAPFRKVKMNNGIEGKSRNYYFNCIRNSTNLLIWPENPFRDFYAGF